MLGRIMFGKGEHCNSMVPILKLIDFARANEDNDEGEKKIQELYVSSDSPPPPNEKISVA